MSEASEALIKCSIMLTVRPETSKFICQLLCQAHTPPVCPAPVWHNGTANNAETYAEIYLK